MADTVRGNGLARAERALAALVEDPQRLERARRRFSDSPPSYTSHQSHNSTQSQSSNPHSEEQRRLENRRWRVSDNWKASFPRQQFAAQMNEEEERIINALENPPFRVRVGTIYAKLAHENVKKRWIEQGNWNNK